MNLEIIILSEVSQRKTYDKTHYNKKKKKKEKDKYHMILLICGI